MAKDRNTTAKRQRPSDKKIKAERNSDPHAKQRAAGDLGEPNSLSVAELAVLTVFRNYLMTPGKMLCFANADLEAFTKPLAQLTDRGMLVAEKFRGGYSLTKVGFAAMNNGA